MDRIIIQSLLPLIFLKRLCVWTMPNSIRLENSKSDKRYLLIILLILSNLSFTTSGFAAPSFNCQLARSVAEKLICANDDISKLDINLSKVYKDANLRVKNMQFAYDGSERHLSQFNQ